MGRDIFMFQATGYYVPASDLTQSEIDLLCNIDIFDGNTKYTYGGSGGSHKFEVHFNLVDEANFYFISEGDIKIILEQPYRKPKSNYFQKGEFAIQLIDYGMHSENVNINFTNLPEEDFIKLNNLIRNKSIHGDFIITTFK